MGPYRRLVRVTPEGATDVSWNSIPSDVQAQMHELNDQIPAPSGKGHVEVPASKGHMETAQGQQDTERESPDDVLQNSQPIDARTRGPQLCLAYPSLLPARRTLLSSRTMRLAQAAVTRRAPRPRFTMQRAAPVPASRG